MYLVDTNVVSATSPAQLVTRTQLLEWMVRNSERLFISTVTVAEIEGGIAKLVREGASRKAERLGMWLEAVLAGYSDRVLPLDIASGRLLGRFSDLVRASGHDPGFFDLAIAATASSRGLVVLTRNLRHFQSMPVPSHDPFESLPLPTA